jgi:predicted ATPase/transcriptional regulator with XRE-family HTH domain
MKDDGRSAFGTLLREFRLAAGLSQEVLAERARLSTEGISVLERGVRKAPYRETVALLARALSLSAPQRERLEAAAVRPTSQPRRRAQERNEVGGNDQPQRGNVPVARTSILGREPELVGLGQILRAQRLVTLTGPGGVGKTRLALEAAAVWEDRFPDGVWFADLAPLTDQELVPRTVAVALGVVEIPKQPLLETLESALRAKQIMLVLDNCEHLIGAVAHLAEALLPGCSKLRLLATSREPLGIAGEHRFPVSPLAVPPEKFAVTVAAVPTYSALSLFAERAGALDADFRVTAQNVAPIAEICRQLDGIPLAIELAAARVRLLSPMEIVSRLDARLRLLTSGSRTALPRQQTLRAAIDWSYDLLEPAEQELFRRLAVFAGRFGFEAASAVCAEAGSEEFAVLDRLSSLIDKSLVTATGVEAGRQRYRLLDSTRLYARERLDTAGESEALRRRLADYVRAASRQTLADGNQDDCRWIDRIEADLDNIRAVLEWAIVEGRDVVFGAEFVDELWRYWLDTGKYLEVKRLSDRILERTPELGDALAGKVQLNAGLLATRRWDVDEGRRSLESALTILRPLDDELQIARALNGLALAHQESGDWERAETLYSESLEIVRRLGDSRALATVLMNLGLLMETQTHTHPADYERAQARYLECLSVAREHGDTAQQAHVLQNLAELALVRDQYDLAIVYAEESLPLWRAHRNEEYVAVSQVLIGTAELARGQHAVARIVLREALPALVELHRGAALVQLFIGLAEVALAEAHDTEAAQLIGFAQNLSLARSLSGTIHEHVTAKARKYSEGLVARARERIDGAVFDAFVRRGRSLTLHQAGDLAATI